MLETTEPTDALRELVSNRSTPAATLKKILEEKYKAILNHDLSTMTTTMLNTEFGTAFGVDGETKKKGVRFFLQAAKANGFTLSKFLLDQTRAVSSGPRKKRNGGKNESDPEIDDGLDDEPISASGTQKTVALQSGGQLSISLSVDLFALSKTDREFVFGLIDTLQTYEADCQVKKDEE